MQRVYAVVKEEIVHLIDDRAKVTGITRSQWISKAIESYLHPTGDDRITQQVTTLNAQLEESLRVKADQLQAEIDKKRTETEQAHRELEKARSESAKYEMAYKSREEEIAFLRGHLSQLSEKLPKALPPSEEEAKAKHWWRFWK